MGWPLRFRTSVSRPGSECTRLCRVDVGMVSQSPTKYVGPTSSNFSSVDVYASLIFTLRMAQRFSMGGMSGLLGGQSGIISISLSLRQCFTTWVVWHGAPSCCRISNLHLLPQSNLPVSHLKGSDKRLWWVTDPWGKCEHQPSHHTQMFPTPL